MVSFLFHGANRMSAKEDLQYAAKTHQPAPFHVLLTSYSLFERRSASSKEDRSMLRKWNWSCVVMDEAHLLKDRNSLRTKHLRLIAQNARHRLMITGTPLQNDLQVCMFGFSKDQEFAAKFRHVCPPEFTAELWQLLEAEVLT